jgi:hypothetical protein
MISPVATVGRTDSERRHSITSWSRVFRPPLDVLLYALSRPDPRERFVALTAVRMAFPALRRDPEWTKRLQQLRDEIGLKDAEHAAMVRKAEGVARALREAVEGGEGADA